MENQHQKWVNLSYLAVAALVGFILFSFSMKLSSLYDIETRVRNIELVLRIGAIVVGGLIFLILYRNEKTNVFMNEVVNELSRVTWPTQKETSSATFVVIVMVLISGVILGAMDYLWTVILRGIF